jgi:WD40 repeat protein
MEIFPEQSDWVSDVATSLDGQWAVTAGSDGQVLVWSEFATWFPARPTYELRADGGSVSRAAFVGDSVVALAGNGTLRRWRLPPVPRFIDHTNWVLGADVSQAGLIATAGADGWGYILDPADPTRRKAWFGKGDAEALATVRFDPADPHRVYTITRTELSAPRAWQWSAGDDPIPEPVRFEAAPMPGTAYLYPRLAVSPDGSTVVAGDTGGGVYFWDSRTGKLRPQRITPTVGYPTAGLAFDPSGRVLAVTVQGGVHLVDPADPGRMLARLPMLNPAFVAFDPTGRYLAAAADGGRVAVWSTTTFDEVSPTPLVAHASTPGALAFSPDGSLLAVGLSDGRVEIWEVATGVTVALTHQHGDLVNDVRFLPGGNGRLVSASDDRTVAVWSCPACDNQQQVIDDALAGP